MPGKSSLLTLIKTISCALAAGHLPSLSEADQVFLEENPAFIADVVEGLLAELTKPGQPERLSAYAWLLSALLEELRYQIEAGYDEAVQHVAAVQTRLAEAIRTGTGTPLMWHEILSTFRHARVPLAPAVRAAFLGVGDADAPVLSPQMQEKATALLRPVLKAILESGINDPFALVDQIDEILGDLYPPLIRVLLLVQMVEESQPVLRDAAVLMLLDQAPAVREAAVTQVRAMCATGLLTLESARRLPVITRWLPPGEQTTDAVADLVRTGINRRLVVWPKPLPRLKFHATISDGAGAMSLYLMGGGDDKALFGGLLFKEQQGLVEVWCGYPTPRQQAEEFIRVARQEVSAFAVGPACVADLVAHGLAVASAPLAGGAALLQLAELIGHKDWTPRRLDIAAVTADLPADLLHPEAITAALERSRDWPDVHAFADSWFETGAVLDQVLENVDPHRQMTLEEMETMEAAVLAQVMTVRRRVWAERFALSALMVRAAISPPRSLPPWPDFMILAKVLDEGRPLHDIPLMQTIASQSILTAASGGSS
ncbi:MAG: hypothetical protein FD153_1874 [Rhodospirillaceae bacterium]|nr:MAG: hypothetical protein FD153_1874 [Rhodospirillaceae bacterium]